MTASLRTMLFVPGNNLSRMEKAFELDADAVIIDLEDSVPYEQKEAARQNTREVFLSRLQSSASVYVRVNSVSSGLLQADLDQVLLPGLMGLVLPEAESVADVEALRTAIREVRAWKGELALIPLLESPGGILNALEIAQAAGVCALAFGALDYARSMGISLSPEGLELLYPRSHLVAAARAAGVGSLDTPWFQIEDVDGLEKDALLARQLGFQGKLVIHPGQIPVVNHVFSPSESEVIGANRVVEAFALANQNGVGVATLDGVMIDRASFRLAQDILSRYHSFRSRMDPGGPQEMP